jgi:hypothetical protein
MTVKELIEHLSELDPELPVFTYGYEGGYNDLEKVLQEDEIVLNVHDEWYYGKHDLLSFLTKDKSKYTTVKGIIL